MSVALKRESILLFAHIGGLIDCLFFLVYNGGTVPLGEWTWMWQYWFFGTWNWNLQVIWSFGFLVLTLALWRVHDLGPLWGWFLRYNKSNY